MTVIMVGMAGPAAHLGWVRGQHGHDRMVHDLLALDAIVVDDIAEPIITHHGPIITTVTLRRREPSDPPGGCGRGFEACLHFGEDPLRRFESHVLADTQVPGGTFEQVADTQRTPGFT